MHYRMRVRIGISVMAALGALCSNAVGGLVTSPDSIPDPDPINFDSLDPGLLTVNAVVSEGVTFPELDGERVLLETDGGGFLIDADLDGDGRIVFEFVDPVTAAGVDFASSSSMFITAYDIYGAPILGEDFEVVPDDDDRGFIGFDGGVIPIIKRIVVHDSSNGFSIDNLRRDPSPVPVPAAIALAALGLGMIPWAKRRSG